MKCKVCGEEITAFRRKIYCSNTCMKKSHLEMKKARHYPDKYYPIKCEICGKEHMSTRKNGRFCSHQCMCESRKKYLTIPDCLDRADRKIDKNLGYVRIYCPMHPKANTWGYVYEHRIIAEFLLGRLLETGEHVHHKDGCRWNNTPDNLEVMTNQEHGRITQYETSNNEGVNTSDELKQIIEFYKSKYGVPPRPDISKLVGTSRLRKKTNLSV